jgi:hypothetical protein
MRSVLPRFLRGKQRRALRLAVAVVAVACRKAPEPSSLTRTPASVEAPSSAATSVPSPPGPAHTSTSQSGAREPVRAVDASAPAPGLDFPAVTANARAGDYVLAPARAWVDEAIERGAAHQTFIYYGGWMVEPGPVESSIDTLAQRRQVIPNAFIIAIRRGERAAPGDVLLTTWASGAGMQRAIVVAGGSAEAPRVRYLDMALDSTSGWGHKDDTLAPNTFHKLARPGEIGTSVACGEAGKAFRRRYTVVQRVEQRLLGLGYAGRVRAFDTDECMPLPVSFDVEKGDQVEVPRLEGFGPAKVTKTQADIGRVWARYEADGERQEQPFAFIDVAKASPAATAK